MEMKNSFKSVLKASMQKVRTYLYGAALLFCSMSLLMGLVHGSKNACVYKSMWSKVNVLYVLGCVVTTPLIQDFEQLEFKKKQQLLDTWYKKFKNN